MDQTKNIENIIRRVWAIETDYQQKTNKTHFITLSSSDKKTKYINQLNSYNMTIIVQIRI